ncbi:T9SS type A sorting domain-containing protein [Flavobacteriaceae bacterium]|nr:T9SS type A sorting domain-containing protein [Flavobacteriaceae bacterium]
MKLKALLISALCAPAAFAQTIVSTTNENKKVILEEFTGIYCYYCPQGHAIAQQLKDDNPDDVFVINIHEGAFAVPNVFIGDPEFRTAYGTAIVAQTGLVGYPAGTVNRHYFPGASQNGQTGTAMGRANWSDKTYETIDLPSYLNMATEADIDLATGEMTILVEAFYTGSSPESSNFLNVALLQNNTIGPQAGATNEFEYNHMHRLVDMITGQWGEEITQTSAGDFVSRTYTYEIPGDFSGVPVVLEDLELVVFMTETTQEVISGNGTTPTLSGSALQNDVSLRLIEDIADQCYGEIAPVVEIKNLGTDVLSSLVIDYTVNDLSYDYTWTGELLTYQTTSIELPEVPFAFSGTNTVSISLADDEDNSNNTLTTTFEDAQGYSGELTLTIETDGAGNQVTWEVRRYDGQLRASGGPYGNNQTYTETISLSSDSCYTFFIFDSNGDGLLSGNGVTLVDSQGTELFYSAGDYGSGTRETFGYQVALGVNDNASIGAIVYPNPAKNTLNISGAESASIDIYDVTGRVVMQRGQLDNNAALDISSLNTGVYFVRLVNNGQTQTEKLIVSK